jgi:hypothetical protein
MENELAGTEPIYQEACYLTDSPIGIEFLKGFFIIKGFLRIPATMKKIPATISRHRHHSGSQHRFLARF